MFRTFINFSHNYCLLMQFTTYVVQTAKVVELVMVELVSDSSKQWALIKIQNIGLNSSEPMSTNVDHNQITINCNTSCNRGDGCMHSCSDTSRQDPYMQTSCYN